MQYTVILWRGSLETNLSDRYFLVVVCLFRTLCLCEKYYYIQTLQNNKRK